MSHTEVIRPIGDKYLRVMNTRSRKVYYSSTSKTDCKAVSSYLNGMTEALFAVVDLNTP